MAIGDGVSALASLGVCFGGFSPTAMDGIDASREYVERLAEVTALKKQADKRRRELETARTSKPMHYIDENGSKWTYVIVDQSVARIVSCDYSVSSLVIPNEIDGVGVYALGPDACSRNDTVEEIICPDSIEFIGSCAFRYCPNLKHVVFPSQVVEFSASWLSHCPSMKVLVLPGGLDAISASVFDNDGIEHLGIGPNVAHIEPGAFQKTHLKTLSISSENQFLKTDGMGIYNADWSVLLALALPVAHYEVVPGTKLIGKKALYGIEALETVCIPESVETIGEFAFSHSGIKEFIAPDSIETIEAKAFYYCDRLRSVKLNEGLQVIGDSAFEESALSELHIPSSIDTIGNSITVKTQIVHSGPNCTLTIDPASTSLFLDGEGGLYRNQDDGIHLVQLVDREMQRFSAFKGCVVVDEYAFAYHDQIREVVLPDGVEVICKNAFRCCGRLEKVDIPDTVRTIGEDAFLDTELESFRVPAALETLGANALVTKGAHHGDEMPSLKLLEVSPENDRFYVKDGMLCLKDRGITRIIMFSSSSPRVVFPEDAVSVEAYAFNNARGIEYIELNPRLNAIGTSGLSTWCWIEHIHVEISEPLEGRTSFDFRFPNTRKGIHGISMGLGGASWVNVPGIIAQYDNCVVNAHDYNSPRNTDSISIYEQVKMIIGRFRDPFMLSKVNRSMYDRLLRNYIVEICVDVARHDDRDIVDALIEYGFIHDENLEDIIGAVGRLQDAAMTGYLLEVKRRRFNQAIFDFDL